MKYIFLSLIISAFYLNSYSQENTSQGDSINQYNSKGQKNGFWVEPVGGDFKAERYYRNGVINGIAKVFGQNNNLMLFGEYKLGKPIGTSYFFHDKGYLTFTIKYLEEVVYKSKKLWKGFFKEFRPNGNIMTSGIGLFVEGDEELGEEIRIGKWKEY